MTDTIFFKTVRNVRGTSLVTLPGQMLTSRTPLKPDFLTHGCEGVRRRYPVGTVFYTTSGVREHSGCYVVKTLFPLALPDGTPASDDLFAQALFEQLSNTRQI